MVKVSLFDILRIDFSKSSRIIFNVTGDAPHGEENICFKAADLMRKRYGIRSGLDIKLTKHIPKESGLGGASSDAASVIKSINKLCDLNLGIEELVALAASIGSDVPFFTNDSPWALVSGRGEVVRGLNPGLDFYSLIVMPPFGVKTKEAYRAWKPFLTHHKVWDKIKHCESADIDFSFLKRYSYNVFEKIAREEKISSLKENLRKLNSEITGMTGTGSAFYALYSNKKEAIKGKELLVFLDSQIYVVKPLKAGGA